MTLFDRIFKPLFGLPTTEYRTLPVVVPDASKAWPQANFKMKAEEKKMSIADFKAKVAAAKQQQQAQHANGKLGDHVGEMMVVTGIRITEDVEIKSASLVMDKVTFNLADGTALDAWHLAATENAKALIEFLGEGPYEPPLLMEVKAQETKRGEVYYAELLDIYDPDGKVAVQDATEHLDTILNAPTANAEQPSSEVAAASQDEPGQA